MKDNYFKCGWDQQKLPISGTVVVIDKSDKCKVGLSAMQMNSLGGGCGDVTLEFTRKISLLDLKSRCKKANQCICSTWNAMGPNATRSDTGIRLTDKAADMLGCKVGDTVTFVSVDNTIKPITV